MINKFYETIIKSDFTLRETVATFDRDGDGNVTASELRQVPSLPTGPPAVLPVRGPKSCVVGSAYERNERAVGMSGVSVQWGVRVVK